MSHHKEVKATLRITNEGRVLSLWFENPYTDELQYVEEWYCKKMDGQPDDGQA